MQITFRVTPISLIQKLKYLRKKSKKNIEEEPLTLLKNLDLLPLSHTQNCHGKSPTRVPSNIKQTSTDRDKDIKGLRNQINETRSKRTWYTT